MLRRLIPNIMKQPYWSRIVLRNRFSPTTGCDKICPMQTLEALLILLSAKPKIFLLRSGACLLNSFVCSTVVLTEVYPEFTVPKQLAIDFNDNFCCAPCLPFATWKVAKCL